MKISEFLVGIVELRSMSFVEESAVGLEAERQRRDVEKDHVLDVAAQNAALHRGADGHDFVGIDVAVRLLAEDRLRPRWTRGMRVWPPTSTTSSICVGPSVRPP